MKDYWFESFLRMHFVYAALSCSTEHHVHCYIYLLMIEDWSSTNLFQFNTVLSFYSERNKNELIMQKPGICSYDFVVHSVGVERQCKTYYAAWVQYSLKKVQIPLWLMALC